MGNVRTEQIKRTGKELLKKFPEEFSCKFEDNKHAVNSLVKGGTPKVLNQIAGYITRFLVAEQRQLREGVPEEEGIDLEGEEVAAEGSEGA